MNANEHFLKVNFPYHDSVGSSQPKQMQVKAPSVTVLFVKLLSGQLSTAGQT